MDEPAKTPEQIATDKETALADQLTAIAVKQYQTAFQYRQPKLDAILKAEELYYNTTKKTLRGRFNIPLPIVSGFVDTLLSKIDDEISINYDHTEIADKIRAQKISAAWKFDSAPTRGMWAIKDIISKKLAIFSGRGIYSLYSESDPVYKNNFEVVDAFDFLAEPSGGWHLENHLFCGVENIFRTKSQLTTGKQYNQTQVQKLISAVNSDEFKNNLSKYQNHQQRLASVGLDPQTNNYVGEPLFNLVQWNMTHDGERYYLFFDPIAGIWVRFSKLAEITGDAPNGELPTYMFLSWATHPDYWNFWSKAPVDDVVPIAVGMKTVTNFMLDRMLKKLFGQRIYDAEVITNPADLEWDRPDKLIHAVLPAGKKLSDAVYEFQTGDDSSVTINLLDYFRNFVALETGVTSGAKGNTDEKLLGIAKINAGEVADRLGLTNKIYTQCHAELGLGYIRGLKMCLPEKMLVRMIGENGIESGEITKDDFNFTVEPDIRITGGKTEFIKNEEKKKAKAGALIGAINLGPDLINKKIAVEEMLLNGEWNSDEIAQLMDVALDGNEEESIRASQAIQDIIGGKTPALYQGATTRFQFKIWNYAEHKVNDDHALKVKLFKYALDHRDIVIENMNRKAMLEPPPTPVVSGDNPVIPANNNPVPPPVNPVAPVLTPA